MNTMKRSVAAAELVLISPAALFMAALLARSLSPAAQQVVTWYAQRMWTLWILLLALPCIVLATGLAMLLAGVSPPYATKRILASIWGQPPARIVAAEVFAAGLILVIVILHMLAN